MYNIEKYYIFVRYTCNDYNLKKKHISCHIYFDLYSFNKLSAVLCLPITMNGQTNQFPSMFALKNVNEVSPENRINLVKRKRLVAFASHPTQNSSFTFPTHSVNHVYSLRKKSMQILIPFFLIPPSLELQCTRKHFTYNISNSVQILNTEKASFSQ